MTGLERLRDLLDHMGERETAHDHSKDVSMSAYDLLPDCDREAISLALDCGGVEEIKKRLMPEGMEWLLEVWPKWSNGEYCKFGDWWKAEKYGEREPQQLRRLAFFTPEQLREWGQDEGENFGYEWDFMRPSDTTYRPDKVEPPAPKVLDADGVEIRVGDEVWHVRGEFGPRFVSKFETHDGRPVAVFEPNGTDLRGCERDQLTHRAPVLAADGRPLQEGEHVYHVETGAELVVKELPKPGEYQAVVVFAPPASHLTTFDPNLLTHERPETRCQRMSSTCARRRTWR